MVELAYALSSEEHDARTLVATAQRAEAAGFRSVWISDHFHPWIDAPRPLAVRLVGHRGHRRHHGADRDDRRDLSAIRIHPAIVAQAAATSANLLPDGRFRLGVGTGEALNEHILGDRWPPADVRLDMLAEAIDVMRKLWTGKLVTHRGCTTRSRTPASTPHPTTRSRCWCRPSGPRR